MCLHQTAHAPGLGTCKICMRFLARQCYHLKKDNSSLRSYILHINIKTYRCTAYNTCIQGLVQVQLTLNRGTKRSPECLEQWSVFAKLQTLGSIWIECWNEAVKRTTHIYTNGSTKVHVLSWPNACKGVRWLREP